LLDPPIDRSSESNVVAIARQISIPPPAATWSPRDTPITQREERRMHLHIVRVAAPHLKTPRPAKVIQLETRRKARLAQERLERSRPRPAA